MKNYKLYDEKKKKTDISRIRSSVPCHTSLTTIKLSRIFAYILFHCNCNMSERQHFWYRNLHDLYFFFPGIEYGKKFGKKFDSLRNPHDVDGDKC